MCKKETCQRIQRVQYNMYLSILMLSGGSGGKKKSQNGNFRAQAAGSSQAMPSCLQPLVSCSWLSSLLLLGRAEHKEGAVHSEHSKVLGEHHERRKK